jgi:hypothetical protein
MLPVAGANHFSTLRGGDTTIENTHVALAPVSAAGQQLVPQDRQQMDLGVGDEAISQIAPAMAQAIFKITGKRLRSLPFGKHDLS